VKSQWAIWQQWRASVLAHNYHNFNHNSYLTRALQGAQVCTAWQMHVRCHVAGARCFNPIARSKLGEWATVCAWACRKKAVSAWGAHHGCLYRGPATGLMSPALPLHAGSLLPWVARLVGSMHHHVVVLARQCRPTAVANL
jgi:hypothetical protein